MTRYLASNEDLEEVFYKVISERFQGLANVNFKLLFDTKKRMKKGNLVLASTELMNEKARYFTEDNTAPEGYDYLVIVDQVVWEYAQDDDKVRLISHELNHVFIDEKGKYKLLEHDINDFMMEVNRNQDKPNWSMDLSTLISDIYEQNADIKG